MCKKVLIVNVKTENYSCLFLETECFDTEEKPSEYTTSAIAAANCSLPMQGRIIFLEPSARASSWRGIFCLKLPSAWSLWFSLITDLSQSLYTPGELFLVPYVWSVHPKLHS